MHTYNFLESILFPPVFLNEEKLKKSIHGKTIVITGASSGIGERLAIILASLEIELTLVLVARRGNKLEAFKQAHASSNISIHTVSADLRIEEDMARVLTFLHSLPNGIDIIVSNAGLSIRRPILKSLDRMHDFTRTMAINYYAPVQLLLSVIPLLQQNNGHIINISTINARIAPVPNWAAYQASKCAFDTWLQSAAPELKSAGITSTSIYLPLVKTPMIRPTKAYDKAPAMTTMHVAKIICQSMYTKKRRYQPWWLLFVELASVLCRKLIDTIFNKSSAKGRN